MSCLSVWFVLGPGTYSFGYEIDDPISQNRQYRSEERLRNGVVRGSFGVLNADGTITRTTYVADQNGYRPRVERHEVAGRQRWLDSGRQRLDEVRHRPSSSSETVPSTVSRDVLFAYPPITRKPVEKSGDRYQSIQQSSNTVEDRTEAMAAFPINSKLSSYFFSPEYLASIENRLHD